VFVSIIHLCLWTTRCPTYMLSMCEYLPKIIFKDQKLIYLFVKEKEMV
jgi:hypothetical protein